MAKPRRILVVDDELSVRWAFEKALQKAGYQVAIAENGRRGLEEHERFHPDLTLLDIRMPEIGGLEVLQRIRERDPKALVIIMTAHGDMETTVNAMKMGAYDFLAKPFDIDDCLALIRRGLEAQAACDEGTGAGDAASPGEPVAGPPPTRQLIGTSARMQEVYKLIGMVAAEDVTVLVTGESGSGKELVAQAIHDNSTRSGNPFWAINCTAIPENLMESELFGHEKGAFTGATGSKPGVFELARGGTLFLDEIGDMSLEMQAKLLRVLEEREIVRVGGSHKIKVDVRIIAATNKDLRRAIGEGRFREDLFHRLKVIEILLPPLRQRPDDIPTLIQHFLALLSQGRQTAAKRFSAEAMTLMTQYAWPGNVRELKNAVDQAFTLSRDQLILPEHLPADVRGIQAGAGVTRSATGPAVAPALSLGSIDPRLAATVAEPVTTVQFTHPGSVGVTGPGAGSGGPLPVTGVVAGPPALTVPGSGTTSGAVGVVDGGRPALAPVLVGAPAEPSPQPVTAEADLGVAIASLVTRSLATGDAGEIHERLMTAVERELILQALQKHRSNQVQTAAFLGITRNTLRAKIEKYGLG